LKKQEKKIERLEKTINQLKARIEKAEQKDEMQKLQEEAWRSASQKKEDRVPPEERKFYSGLRQHSVLNPNISVGGDYYLAYGTSDSKRNRQLSDISWGTGQFFVREIEVSAQAALDPYSRGKVFLGLGEEGAGVEEGIWSC
jgi:restriction endonuclease S subunit